MTKANNKYMKTYTKIKTNNIKYMYDFIYFHYNITCIIY